MLSVVYVCMCILLLLRRLLTSCAHTSYIHQLSSYVNHITVSRADELPRLWPLKRPLTMQFVAFFSDGLEFEMNIVRCSICTDFT